MNIYSARYTPHRGDNKAIDVQCAAPTLRRAIEIFLSAYGTSGTITDVKIVAARPAVQDLSSTPI